MLSFKTFRDNLSMFFGVMSSTDAYIDVAWCGKLYRVEVTEIGIAPPRKHKKKTLKHAIEKQICPECGGLMLNKVCMATTPHQSKNEQSTG
jgi:hypothetical protein